MVIDLLSKQCAVPGDVRRVSPSPAFYNPVTQLYDWNRAVQVDVEAGYTTTGCGSASGDVYGSCQDGTDSDDTGGGDHY
jgi:hypothetical protein